jgi:hypothetical protein
MSELFFLMAWFLNWIENSSHRNNERAQMRIEHFSKPFTRSQVLKTFIKIIKKGTICYETFHGTWKSPATEMAE